MPLEAFVMAVFLGFIASPVSYTHLDVYKRQEEGPQAATDWFYKFSQDTDYIRRYRIKRDVKWVTKTPYGDLDITCLLYTSERMWHLPAPRMASIAAVKASGFSSGTKACTGPAKPPP